MTDPTMAHAQFHLVYDGPALEEHRMDVRALAPALLAMGALFERANEMLNGDQAKVSLNVKASFKSGSFGIDFDLVQSLWKQMLDLMGNSQVQSVKEMLEWLGLIVAGGSGATAGAVGVVRLIKWLRGRGIKKIEPIGNGIVRLFVDDEFVDVEERVVQLLRDYRIRKHLEGVFSEPLENPGVETVAIVDDKTKQVHVVVEKSEARFFVAPDPSDETVNDDTYIATLQVLNLAFQDGNKWKFTEGGNSYFATVLDEDFLRRVQSNHEKFAKDDVISARVRRVQRLTKDGLRADYEVLEVLEHRSATPQVQIKLEFGGESGGGRAET